MVWEYDDEEEEEEDNDISDIPPPPPPMDDDMHDFSRGDFVSTRNATKDVVGSTGKSRHFEEAPDIAEFEEIEKMAYAGFDTPEADFKTLFNSSISLSTKIGYNQDSEDTLDLDGIDSSPEVSNVSKNQETRRVDESTDSNQPPVSKLVRRIFNTLTPSTSNLAQQSNPPYKNEGGSISTIPQQTRNKKVNDCEIDKLSSKLEFEISQYTKSNQELENGLNRLRQSELELDRKSRQLDIEQKKIEKSKEEILSQAREEARQERIALKHERQAIERQKEYIEILRNSSNVDRKDRAVIDSLQATIVQLKQVDKDNQVKFREAIKRKNDIIDRLKIEAQQLEVSLKQAELRRLDQWEENAKLQATINDLTARMQNLESKLAAKVAAETTTPVPSTLDIENIPLRENCQALVTEEIERKNLHGDESKRKIVTTRKDGTRVVKYPNGSIKETLPTGESTITYANGDVEKLIPREGIRIYYFSDSDTTQTTYEDGTKVLEFSNGQIERSLPSGNYEIFYTNGASTTIFPDKRRVTNFPEGVQVTIGPNGDRKVSRSGSSRITDITTAKAIVA